MIVGLCCEYCIKQETNDCPVSNASPWSRWANFCSEFENKEGDTLATYLKPKENKMNHKCINRRTDDYFKEFCMLTGKEKDCENCIDFVHMLDTVEKGSFMYNVLSDKLGEKNEKDN